jgi:hypothetical protein
VGAVDSDPLKEVELTLANRVFVPEERRPELLQPEFRK